MSKEFKPSGYNSVSPYFIVKGAQRLIDLLKNIFDDASDKFPPVPIVTHVYVPDVDKTFDQAIAAGCEVIEKPKQQENDPDRRGTFKDFAGNMWSIGTQR